MVKDHQMQLATFSNSNQAASNDWIPACSYHRQALAYRPCGYQRCFLERGSPAWPLGPSALSSLLMSTSHFAAAAVVLAEVWR